MVDFVVEGITKIEKLEDFNDEYVYDIIMEDDTTPYFFANDILVHNSIFLNLSNIVKNRYGDKEPDKETIAKFLVKYHEKIIEPKIEEFFNKLNKNLNMFAFSLEMEYEGLSSAVIFVEKKKYCMAQVYSDGKWYLDKPKMKIKGIEVVRTSTPFCVREKIRETLDLIFETGDNKLLIAFIEKFRKEFYKMSFEEVAMPRGVNFYGNRTDKRTGVTNRILYELGTKGLPINVRAAYIFNKALKDFKLEKKYPPIENGDKIRYAYIKQPNYLHSEIVGCSDKLPKELKDKFQIDYPKMFDKTFMSPLEKIFSTIDFKTEESGLDDFF
jgi:DNA polymerase elongation subunit (family B)